MSFECDFEPSKTVDDTDAKKLFVYMLKHEQRIAVKQGLQKLSSKA